MRIVTCPKCNDTRCSEMATKWVGEAVRMQCQGCGYYAERKEFKIERIEVAINSYLDKINSELKKLSSDLEYIKSNFDI